MTTVLEIASDYADLSGEEQDGYTAEADEMLAIVEGRE